MQKFLNYLSLITQEALRALWRASFPEDELRGLISEQWKEMGWQGKDPSTDFRSVFLGSELFIVLAQTSD